MNVWVLYRFLESLMVWEQRWTYRKRISGQLMVRYLTALLGVVLDIVKEPTDRGLVILMLLALQDDFFAPKDELLASLFWKVFFGEELASALVETILVVRRNAVGDVLLLEGDERERDEK